MTQRIFGGLVAFILLGLYGYSVLVAIWAARCLGQPPCTAYVPELNEGVVTILNLVGGLVSALVVAELAVTQPTGAPAARLFSGGGAPKVSELTKKWLMAISISYILVWLICGLASLIVGYLQHPNVVPALTASAKSWLGLAVAAAYSYLGIKK